MSAIHTSNASAHHAYTRSTVPWVHEENRDAAGETSDGKRFGWRLFHYLSGGGMRAFGRTVRQEEIERRQNRFLAGAAVFAAVWLVLLIA